MPSWKTLVRKYSEKDVVVAVHIGYGREDFYGKISEEVDKIQRLNFPIIEVVSGRAYLSGNKVEAFPTEDELKGNSFGTVYLCGSQRDRCILRMEAALSKNCKGIVKLERLIH